MPPAGGIFIVSKLLALLALLGALALLVRDTAAGLASGLAGSLALAAAALLCALAQIAGLDGLDVLHDGYLHKNSTAYYNTYSCRCQYVWRNFLLLPCCVTIDVRPREKKK